MIPVAPFMQGGDGYCGPACLKIVLQYYGISVKEEELIGVSYCSVEHGLPGEALLDAARRYGLEGEIRDRSELDELSDYVNQQKIPVIVNWFDSFDGHYSVAVGLDEENVYLADPELGHLRALRRDIFLRLWFDFRGDYIKEPVDLILRRMIVLRPASEPYRVIDRDREYDPLPGEEGEERPPPRKPPRPPRKSSRRG